MWGFGQRYGRIGWRAKRAVRAAELLDELVDGQLPLLAGLSEASRRRSADYLAELVLLAQAYRHYAAGWISRKELERRGRLAVLRLDDLRSVRATPQLTEQD
ncbi:hypothetical protein D5S17_24955 [Pseudonocardiaceae bacterium YIM PH 21723]|nr:hypothetical protein D5S17_24955 [Pseudonocardiaceae bacterium YIM PH 21723]